VYLALAAGLVFLLVRRLAFAGPVLPFLAGVIAATWAPLDMGRLAVVQCSINSGATFGVLLALYLFLESERRRSLSLLAMAVLVGLVTARSYEAVLGLLAGAPLLLLVRGERPGRGRWVRVVAWESGVAMALTLAVAPLLTGGGGSSYQREVLGLDVAPARLVTRLLRQFALHLMPLAPTAPEELLHVAVALAVAVFLASAWWLGFAGKEVALPARRRLLALAALGIAFAALGYGPFVVSASVWNATRMQFLSGFGIALLLASAFALGASFLPGRARGSFLLAAGAWVVAVGTGHTLAMQRAWDRASFFPAQRATLRQLTELAPSLRANTLVLLVDEAGAWPMSFGFRHAVAYLYGPQVVGHVVGTDDLLYTARATPAGIVSLPAPTIREAWGCPPTLHRGDEILAVRLAPTGVLSLLEAWDPRLLLPLPAGARYDPRARILHPSRLPPERAVLADGAPAD
jgi:hypothetical protein